MRQRLETQQRKKLEAEMARIFKENISVLSTEFQKILLDDMVTAFQNRIIVLIRAQAKGIDAPTLEIEKPEEMRARLARHLMMKLKPIKIRLEVGGYLRLDEELVAKKDEDGKITFYEVVK